MRRFLTPSSEPWSSLSMEAAAGVPLAEDMLALFSYGSSLHWARMDHSGEVADKESIRTSSIRGRIQAVKGKYLHVLATNWDLEILLLIHIFRLVFNHVNLTIWKVLRQRFCRTLEVVPSFLFYARGFYFVKRKCAHFSPLQRTEHFSASTNELSLSSFIAGQSRHISSVTVVTCGHFSSDLDLSGQHSEAFMSFHLPVFTFGGCSHLHSSVFSIICVRKAIMHFV